MDWYRHKVPKGAEESAYVRLFAYKETYKFVKSNPFGYGFSRDIFSKIANKKYNLKNFKMYADSSLINILLSSGILGFIIYSAIMILLMYIGIKNFLVYKSYFGLLLFYLASSFYFRSFLDDLFKNHYLQQFVFLAALTFFAMKREIGENNIFKT
jgi:O-antigen ligase